MGIRRQRAGTAETGRAGELEARALAALEARDPATAVEYYRQALALCPLNPDLRRSMADALLLLARAKGPRTSRASGIPLPEDEQAPAPAPPRSRAPAAAPPQRRVAIPPAPVPRTPEVDPDVAARATAQAPAGARGAASPPRPLSGRVRGLFEGDEEPELSPPDQTFDEDPVGLDFGPAPRPGRGTAWAPSAPAMPAGAVRVAPPVGAPRPRVPALEASAPRASMPPPAPVSPRVLRGREPLVSGRFLVMALLFTGGLLVLAGAVTGALRSLLAEASLPTAVAANLPPDVTQSLEEAQSHLVDRQPEKAIAVLDAAAARHPGHAEWFGDAQGRAWRAKGNAHRLAGEFDKAVAAFEKAAELDPYSPDNWIDLARARESSAVRLANRDKAGAARLRQAAAEAYAKATEAAPESSVAWFGLGEMKAALGDRAAAESAWRRAQRAAPESAIAQAARERLERPPS